VVGQLPKNGRHDSDTTEMEMGVAREIACVHVVLRHEIGLDVRA
jgi:hypothetical protein